MPNAISKPDPHANVYCNSSMCANVTIPNYVKDPLFTVQVLLADAYAHDSGW